MTDEVLFEEGDLRLVVWASPLADTKGYSLEQRCHCVKRDHWLVIDAREYALDLKDLREKAAHVWANRTDLVKGLCRELEAEVVIDEAEARMRSEAKSGSASSKW